MNLPVASRPKILGPRAAVAGAIVLATAAGFGIWQVDRQVAPTWSDFCQNPAASLSWAGFVACHETIVEGDVVSVGPGSGVGRQSVTLAVADWLKPSDGPATTTLDVVLLPDGANTFDVGGHYLVIDPGCDEPSAYASRYAGVHITETRAHVLDALSESLDLDDDVPAC